MTAASPDSSRLLLLRRGVRLRSDRRRGGRRRARQPLRLRRSRYPASGVELADVGERAGLVEGPGEVARPGRRCQSRRRRRWTSRCAAPRLRSSTSTVVPVGTVTCRRVEGEIGDDDTWWRPRDVLRGGLGFRHDAILAADADDAGHLRVDLAGIGKLPGVSSTTVAPLRPEMIARCRSQSRWRCARRCGR